MSANNGGPAFPTREKIGETFDDYKGTWRDEFGDFGGMTLRDYFAASIANGMHSNSWLMKERVNAPDKITKRLRIGHPPNDEVEARNLQEWMAETAYQFADAMLKARES